MFTIFVSITASKVEQEIVKCTRAILFWYCALSFAFCSARDGPFFAALLVTLAACAFFLFDWTTATRLLVEAVVGDLALITDLNLSL